VFEKLTLNPAYRVVAEAIEANILQGKLKIGDRLPSELTLAKQFGVHRSTVREGLRLLEQSGLVARVGRTTLEVLLPHFKDLATRASRALAMHQVTFQELWDVSMLTEPNAAAAAATHIEAAEIEQLDENIAAMAGAVDDTDRFVRLDIEFHNIIVEASRNRVLALVREPISYLFLPAGQLILPRLKTYERVIRAHREIRNALARGDREGVQQWMTRHMADFRRAYLKTGLDPEQPLQPLAFRG
jgi:DNA-binding FadR family transcriptional regulator